MRGGQYHVKGGGLVVGEIQLASRVDVRFNTLQQPELIAAPGIVNLSYFELHTGFRYVVPLTRIIGIGIEPAYAFNQKQLVMNANLHFALR